MKIIKINKKIPKKVVYAQENIEEQYTVRTMFKDLSKWKKFIQIADSEEIPNTMT